MNGTFKKAMNDLAHYVQCARAAANRAWQAAPNGDCKDVLTDVIQRLVSIADDGRAEASSGLVCEAWETGKKSDEERPQ